jgi:hypothetical protein
MFRVVSTFADLQDGKYLYKPGDTFPRQGLTVDAARIASLASCDNATGKALIQAVEPPVEAANDVPRETHARSTKPAQTGRRGRRKGA